MPKPSEHSSETIVENSDVHELFANGEPAFQEHIITMNVAPGERPERIDQYLTRMLPNASRTKVHEAIDAQAIRINGAILSKASYKVKGEDVIEVTIPRPAPMRAEAEDIPLNIVYEDDAILIINKPAGMVVHPAFGSRNGTLVNALLHHMKDFAAAHAGMDPNRPGIVHRLDKDTSGLMVVAKTIQAHRVLAKQFFLHTAHRVYNAIVWGNPKNSFGEIDTLIARHPKDRKRFSVAPTEGKQAITQYFVLEEFTGFSLVELRLKTGRTHQIRVHMQHLGHPVFGDATYSGRAMNVIRHEVPHFKHWVDNLLAMIPRQALHAKSLRLHHPTTNELMEWSVPLPEDMEHVLTSMRAMRDHLYDRTREGDFVS
jgi:23S rRNA pseudouridine1911/1915/1917 synthase